MVQVRAIYDGEKIVLPPYVRAFPTLAKPVTVVVEFPEGTLVEDHTWSRNAERPPRSFWDLVDDDYMPKRTVDEALDQLDEGRDDAPPPLDTRGPP